MKLLYMTQAIYDQAVEDCDKAIREMYSENMDYLTARMTRKKTLGTWTEEDEKEYASANEECHKKSDAYKEKLHDPRITIISEEEYAAMEEAERAKRQAEYEEHEKQRKEKEEAERKQLEEDAAKQYLIDEEARNKNLLPQNTEECNVREIKKGKQVL